ncbi:MAG: GNAT family N-acetyltransferase [bacterium]|nr:GNAT family N-acetyltransferase [bacterium]
MIRRIGHDEISHEQWSTFATHNTPYSLFSEKAWHETWATVFGELDHLEILLVHDEIIAPCIRNGDELSFSGGTDLSDYMDIIGPEESKASAWNEILEYCKKEKIASLRLHNIPENSATLGFFQTLPKKDIVITREDTTPILKLPRTWDQYLASLSRHKRHEIKRKTRNFEHQYPDAHAIVSEHPDHDIAQLFDLMRQNPDKKRFLTVQMEHFFRKIVDEFREVVILELLVFGSKSCAASLSFITPHTQLLYNSGYCLDNPGAGLYLHAKSIQRAIETNRGVYNFLQGDERYKYDFGAKDFMVYAVSLAL